MPSSKSITEKFNELKFILENKDRQSIKMESHGGYSILFVYPPQEEKSYLNQIHEKYPDAHFINIADLLVKYIDSHGKDEFFESYQEFENEPEKLFKSDYMENDFFQLITNEIDQAGQNIKLPILVRTGALIGTGIENINLMDSKIVQNLPLPLVIMYPATIGADGKLKFLNHKLASDYRAIVID